MFLQFVYPEGPVALRLLRLRHSHVRQNITYSCDGDADGFMQAELLGINGGIIQYGDKTLRMISPVREVLFLMRLVQSYIGILSS